MGNIGKDLDFKENYMYEGDLGVIYSKRKSVFKVWAPTADDVDLALYDDGVEGIPIEIIDMKKDDSGVWSIEKIGDLDGMFYTYLVNINGIVNEAVDIYAKAVGVNGIRGAIVDLEDTNPSKWDMDIKPEFNNETEAIIYELHVRDLSSNSNSGIFNKGKFLGATEIGTTNRFGDKTGLDHIKELGVTHVHLLPVFDYGTVDESRYSEKEFNWGYDPENYNAVEGSYSTDPFDPKIRIKEFKELVKTFHENGIRVVMDVVYNHTYKIEESNFNKIVPNYYYRHNEDGSFSNGSGCGNETASERAMVKKFIIDSLKYWEKEYHIDGFRFDLMGVHDVDTINIIRKEMDKIDKSIILYGEGWTGGDSPLPYEKKAVKNNAPLLNERVAVFSDDIRDGVKGSAFFKGDKGFANCASGKEEIIKFGVVASTFHPQVNYWGRCAWAKEPSQTVNYVSAHDNLTLWDKILCANENFSEEDRIRMDILSNGIILTSQGISFIHAGEEMLRTKGGSENSYNLPDSVNGLDWDRKHKYRRVFDYYKGLIELRKKHKAFTMTSAEDIRRNLEFFDYSKYGKNIVGFMIKNHANGDKFEKILVIYNGSTQGKDIILQQSGWHVLVNDITAGTKSLGKVEGTKVWVPRLSMIVLADAMSFEKINE